MVKERLRGISYSPGKISSGTWVERRQTWAIKIHVVVFWVTGGSNRYKKKGHWRQIMMTHNLSSAGSAEWLESNYPKMPPVRYHTLEIGKKKSLFFQMSLLLTCFWEQILVSLWESPWQVEVRGQKIKDMDWETQLWGFSPTPQWREAVHGERQHT